MGKKTKLATHKPAWVSVHLHECSVDDTAAAAVYELVRGRERCVCGRVGECLFGQDWWEESIHVEL